MHDMDDPLVHQTKLVNEVFAHASIPGAFVVIPCWYVCLKPRRRLKDYLIRLLFSPVQRVPGWFPRTLKTAQLGREWGTNGRALAETAFELVHVRARRVRSPYPGLRCLFVRTCLIQAADVSILSFTDENITEGITEQEEDLVKWAANSKVIRYVNRSSGLMTQQFLSLQIVHIRYCHMDFRSRMVKTWRCYD